ncbi:hypothetical protein BTM25_26810 [Actinomadura rubteroloni]|uniref:DUF397 domain-containing protein n=1 Tax=Actinomadura rubteroloni TaxID=1926885 RepID=A0A2P4UG64_9ACTN|nr:DUF397 domain-containing protein [Actinomadura rubteroloni]POM24054.1 hypothetical protein BTM25_26810 [Actinomadura rubteroloni]
MDNLSAAVWRKSKRSTGQGGNCVELTSAVVWRKSARSSAQGGDCVELASTVAWRKSTRSTGQGGDCVELAQAAHVMGIRDSKAPEAGHLDLPIESATAFLDHIKSGALDADW